MNPNENILEQLQALQLGPAWSEGKAQGKAPYVSSEKERTKRRKPFVKAQDNKPFVPVVEVGFRPQEAAFQALIHSLKDSHKTYQLFHIANLFLEKAERFVVSIKPKQGCPAQKGLYCALPDNVPFLKEEDALNYAMAKQWEHYFEEEVVTLERPNGNFQSVSRCGMSGRLLGPPNYHRYAELLKEHYNRELGGRCSYDAFVAAIKNEKETSSVEQWLSEMTQGKRYRLKADPAHCFESQEAAKRHLIQNFHAQLVRFNPTTKFPGTQIDSLQDSMLKKSVEVVLEIERRFPLETANFLRGRFHHLGFHIYKKGKKGISYVCHVKRKIRDDQTSFSASIESLIGFIEQHKAISIAELPKQYFNIQDLSELDTKVDADRVKQFKVDLHWLISEGYVTEYENGILSVSPKQPVGHNPKQEDSKEVSIVSEAPETDDEGKVDNPGCTS